jgi:hypothetical protein
MAQAKTPLQQLAELVQDAARGKAQLISYAEDETMVPLDPTKAGIDTHEHSGEWTATVTFKRVGP